MDSVNMTWEDFREAIAMIETRGRHGARLVYQEHKSRFVLRVGNPDADHRLESITIPNIISLGLPVQDSDVMVLKIAAAPFDDAQKFFLFGRTLRYRALLPCRSADAKEENNEDDINYLSARILKPQHTDVLRALWRISRVGRLWPIRSDIGSCEAADARARIRGLFCENDLGYIQPHFRKTAGRVLAKNFLLYAQEAWKEWATYTPR